MFCRDLFRLVPKMISILTETATFEFKSALVKVAEAQLCGTSCRVGSWLPMSRRPCQKLKLSVSQTAWGSVKRNPSAIRQLAITWATRRSFWVSTAVMTRINLSPRASQHSPLRPHWLQGSVWTDQIPPALRKKKHFCRFKFSVTRDTSDSASFSTEIPNPPPRSQTKTTKCRSGHLSTQQCGNLTLG